jgi:hypothetical protein
MQEESSLLAPCGAEGTQVSASGLRKDESSASPHLRLSVAGRNAFRSFRGALALAILAGCALGFELGLRAGDPGLPAGARKAETAAWLAAPGAAEVARLREGVRGLRAQIEQLRHLAEASKTGERLKALETAHEAGAAQAQLLGATVLRLGQIETRLERLERAQADPTPTGSIKRQKTAAP